MNITDDDFGFSLVSEDELKAHEAELKKQIEQQSKVVEQVQQSAIVVQDKLHQLRDMIMPLLKNLAKDPEKQYILWPDRAEKMKVFIKKVNTFVDGK
jgi:uncharacterized coiled-coil DUF342 family protein